MTFGLKEVFVRLSCYLIDHFVCEALSKSILEV